MDQATGNLPPGVNIQLVNNTITSKNDVNVTASVIVNNADSILIRLKNLLNPVTSAGYDSYEAGQRSECFPDTRLQVLHDIEDWIKGESNQAPIYILDGVAGIGKSTVAQTIAMRTATLGLLGASFFFSRDEESRTVARHFFPTIAYQLSEYDNTFTTYLVDSLNRNPNAPAKLLNQQLTLLLVEPLQKLLSQRRTPTLIVVDALDECEETGAEELLNLLGQHVPRIKGLKIFITSRPEAHLRHVLDQAGSHEKFSLHEIEDSIVHSDIRLYLRFRLSVEEIRKASRLRNATWQPTNAEMEMLCGICGTLFIIGATAIKFILSSSHSTPKKQLSRLLDGVSASNFAGSKYNDALDHTYIRILCAPLSGRAADDREWLGELNRVLGALIVLANPLPCEALASLLEMDPDDIEATLSQLHSLVAPTTNTENSDTTFRIHHKSFPDFITNKERINRALTTWKTSVCSRLDSLLWVEVIKQHLQLAKACFKIMDLSLKKNMASINEEDWYKDKEDIPHIRPELIPRELAYAAMHWASHLRSAQGLHEDSEIQMCLHNWTSRHILSWIETMVILNRVSDIYGILQDAIKCLPEKFAADRSWAENRKVSELLSDACRFVQQGSEVMRISPMHIYSSCLSFTPIETSLYRIYGIMALVRIEVGKSDKWNASIATLIGHSSLVKSVAFSADGSRLASGSDDKTVRLWDANTGTHLSTLTDHSSSVNSVAFSANGSRLASGSSDKTVRLWDTNTGSHLSTLPGHSSSVKSVAFSADGSRLASGSYDQTVRLWDAETGAHLSTLTGHSQSVNSVAFSADGSRLASGSDDYTMRLWDANTGAHLSTLTGHSSLVTSVAFSADGSRLASGSYDQTVRLWDAKTGAHLSTLTGHSQSVNSVAFSADGSQLASGSDDKTVRLWDANTGAHLSTLTGHLSLVNSVAFSADGSRLASGSIDNTVRLWDVNTGSHLTTPSLTRHSSFVTSVAFSADGSRLASGSYDQMVRLWDAKNGAHLSTLIGHSGSVNSAAFSADGSRLASGSYDQTVRLWDAETGAHLSTLTGHSQSVNSVAFSADGSRLASGSDDYTVRLWDANTGTHLSTSTGHSSLVNSVAFSADGSRLASGSYDQTVRLWDANTGAHLSTLTGHSSSVRSIAFSADGSRLASGSNDYTVRLWDANTGTHLSTLTGPSGLVLSVAFSADGSRLASGTSDTTVRLWDANTGAQPSTLPHLPNSISSLPFVLNGLDIIHQTISQGSTPIRCAETPDPTFLFLLVWRKNPSIFGIMTANLMKDGRDNSRWVIASVCWLPPDIGRCFSVDQLTPRIALGCDNGCIMTLSYSSHRSIYN